MRNVCARHTHLIYIPPVVYQGADPHACNGQGKTPLYLAPNEPVRRIFQGVS